MVVKINSKPIEVKEREEGEGIDWLYVGVSATCSMAALWVLDYVSYLFLYIHPFPFMVKIAEVLAWLF